MPTKQEENSPWTFVQSIAKQRRWWVVPIGTVIVGVGFLTVSNLIDLTPPNLEIIGIEKGNTYRGRITLKVSAADARSGVASIDFMLDDSPQPLALDQVEMGNISWTLDTTSLSDGSHVVSVVAADTSIFRNKFQQSFEFLVDNTPPQVNVPPESLRVGQGRTLALFIQVSEPAVQVEGKLFGWNFTCHPVASDTYFRGLIGIGVTHPAKSYPLALRVVDIVGNTAEEVFQLEVERTMFQRAAVTLHSRRQNAGP